MHKFRFPHAILHYVKTLGLPYAIEKAREFSIGDEKPSAMEAEEYIEVLLKDYNENKEATVQY